MIKKIAFALASSLMLIACGDDKSSSAPPSEFFSFEDSFEIAPKSEAALRAEALAVRKRSRSYAKPPVPQPSVKAAAAAIGK